MSKPAIHQLRAAAAWRAVKDGVKGKSWASEYAALAKSAPADIQTSGLGQTLAFWFAKSSKEPAHKALLGHVSDWVLSRIAPEARVGLLEWITQVDSEKYRRATLEAMEYLVWIKRFAEGELGNG